MSNKKLGERQKQRLKVAAAPSCHGNNDIQTSFQDHHKSFYK